MTSDIGIDVGKKYLQIYFPIINKSFEVTNDQQGFKKLLTDLIKYYNNLLSELIIVFEPTAGYEKNLRDFLKSVRVNFTNVHPNKVCSYAKAKGLLGSVNKSKRGSKKEKKK